MKQTFSYRLSDPQQYRVITLGESGTDKFHLNESICYGLHKTGRLTTALIYHFNKKYIIEESTIQLCVYFPFCSEINNYWNTQYAMRPDVVLLAFDKSRARTFESLSKCIRRIKIECGKYAIKVLIGSKSEKNNEISYDLACEFAQKHDMFYIETKSNTGENYEFIFEFIATLIYQRNKD